MERKILNSKYIKNFTPPIIIKNFNAVNKYFQLHGWEPAGEKNATWYDKAFYIHGYHLQHYTESKYYFLNALIAERIIQSGVTSILDIGCGGGEIAAILRDRGFKKYVGFDFSEKRIQHARKICPEFHFEVADAFKTNLYFTVEYDAVICNEFLEHVENDIEVIKKIPRDKKFYGAIPNYPLANHVRYFEDTNSIHTRYGNYFKLLKIDRLLRDSKNHILYLLEGITSYCEKNQ